MSGSHSLVCPFIKKLPGFAFKRSRDILGTAPARAQDIGGKTRTLNIPHWQGKSRRWLENPYHQYFCGEEYFCHELPIDPSSLSRWRGRIGEQGSELIHAPEAEYIGKGKAHKQYEFGVKVSVAVSNRDNFVVGMLAEPGNPYDGHTLTRAIGQVERITGRAIERSFVDRGYRGHGLKIP